MGIHGLTTYLSENRRPLAKDLEFSKTRNDVSAAFVVDGWSFIYDLQHHSGLPWVFGGEYESFFNLVIEVVEAWIGVGLKIYFVFDGPAPPLKFPTIINRIGQSNVQPSLLFFRTSPASRTTQRFLNESRIIPPLSYAACLHGLQTVAVTTDALEIHFADEEGDPYAVELAGRVGGYVIGRDSDFVVLNSEGYMGYIPLKEMVWNTRLEEEGAPNEEDGDFQPVRKGKGRKKPGKDHGARGGLIPPNVQCDLTLTCTAYDPTTLASHLNVPVTLLPLLGALVGNDFTQQSLSTRRNVQQMLFERRLTPSQRITHAASTLASILSSASLKRKQKHVSSVMDLIDKTVNALLIRSPNMMSYSEMEMIIEKIVDATLQYAISRYVGDTERPDGLWPTHVCPLHDPDVCPILPLLSRHLSAMDEEEVEGEDMKNKSNVRALYLTAYRNGQLFPEVMDVLNTGTYWPRLFLEHPDTENVARSIGRSIRQWGYAILEEGVGLPEGRKDSEYSTDQDEGDNLIDVVEDNSDEDGPGEGDEDPLAPLRGALQQLRMPQNGVDSEPTPSVSSHSLSVRPPPPKVVAEYVRRGTRVAPEEVAVPPLSELLSSISIEGKRIPIQLWPEQDRLMVLLRICESDSSSVAGLPPEHLMAVLALRLVVRTFNARALESHGSRERLNEKWTQQEARCFLASFSWAARADIATELDAPPIIDRHIQLTAQILMALECLLHLSQILLLHDRVVSTVHLFSGRAFHTFLTDTESPLPEYIPGGLWAASTDGLEDAFNEERRRNEKKAVNVKPHSRRKGPPVKRPVNGGFFGLLGGAEA